MTRPIRHRRRPRHELVYARVHAVAVYRPLRSAAILTLAAAFAAGLLAGAVLAIAKAVN